MFCRAPPNLTHSNFHLFPHLKKFRGEKQFLNDANKQNTVIGCIPQLCYYFIINYLKDFREILKYFQRTLTKILRIELQSSNFVS